MRILMINDLIPYPIISGASLRTYNLLRRIAGEHEVWFTAFVKTPEQMNGVLHLRELCHGVEIADMQETSALSLPIKAISYLAAGIPPDIRYFQSDTLENKIHELISKVDFDVVQIEHATMGLYLRILPYGLRSRAVWMLHDIDWIKFARISELEKNAPRKLRLWLHSRMMRHWKPRFAEQFKRCITVSESDRRLLMAANPRLQADEVPNGVDTKIYQPLPQEKNPPALIFVGDMGYLPCADGISFFCKEVLPHIRSVIKDLELWIVGINPPIEIRQLHGNGIHVTGRVEDIRPYYGRSTVSIVPLRAGSGTRLKILEAMALGRPVVSTSIGCEGLDVVDGDHLFIADTAEQFAKKTLCLLTNEKLIRRITNQARELVVTHYDWDAIARKLVNVYVDLIGQSQMHT